MTTHIPHLTILGLLLLGLWCFLVSRNFCTLPRFSSQFRLPPPKGLGCPAGGATRVVYSAELCYAITQGPRRFLATIASATLYWEGDSERM